MRLGDPDRPRQFHQHGQARGAPDSLTPLSDSELKKRTLTNLYNQKPQWLLNAHKALDEAVFAAYGWPNDLGEEEILGRLLELNQKRALVVQRP